MSSVIRFRYAGALLVLVLTLAACGGVTSEDETSAVTATAESAPTEGVEAAEDEPQDAPAASATATSAPGESDAPPSGDVGMGAGVTEDTITLGMLNDLTGPTVAIGEPLEAGIRAAIDSLNADGGVAGRQVELVVEDHAFNPQTAVQQYRGMADDVLALVTVEGEPNTLAVRDEASQENVFFWPGTYTSEYVASIYTPVATPYYYEALNAVDFIVNDLDGQGATIGGFALESGIGRDYQRVWDDLESLYDVTAGPLVYHAAADTDYTGAVQQMIDADVDYVLLGTAPTQAAAILSTMQSLGLSVPAVGAAVSYSPQLLDTNAAEVLLDRVYIASPWAAWDDDAEGQQALRDAIGDVTPDLNIQAGWVMTQALAQVIEEAAASGALTHEGVTDAVSAVDTFSLNGVAPDITVGEGQGGQFVSTRESNIFSITEDGLQLERPAFVGSGAEAAELDLSEES